MNIEHLRLVVWVAQLGSFSQAARQAGVSQSAASQALAQVERDLGVALFDRSCRPVAVTAAGRRFVAGIDSTLDAFDKAVASLQGGNQALAGTVTVATIPSLGLHLLIALAQRFAEQHPGIRIRTQHLEHDLVVAAVRERRCDIGLLSFPPRLRGVSVHHLRDETLVLVCHPGHRLVARRRVTLGDLAGQDFIAFDRDFPIRKAIDAALRRAGVRPRLAMELDNIESIKQAVLNQCGVAILPEPMVRHETHGRLLMALPIDRVDLRRPVAALCRSGAIEPAAAAFLAFIRAQVAAPPGAVPSAPLRYGQTPSPWE